MSNEENAENGHNTDDTFPRVSCWCCCYDANKKINLVSWMQFKMKNKQITAYLRWNSFVFRKIDDMSVKVVNVYTIIYIYDSVW